MDFQTLLCLQLCSVATSKLEYHMDFTLGRAILRQSWYKSNLYDIILKSVVIIMSQKKIFCCNSKSTTRNHLHVSLDSLDHRTAEAKRNLKASSGPTFSGKGSLGDSIWDSVQPQTESF